MTWDDAATGLRVEYVEISGTQLRGGTAMWPRPAVGPQFKVSRPTISGRHWVKGYARTAAELDALGVPADLIAAIKKLAGQ